MSVNYRRLNEARMMKEQQYVNDLKEMLFITSHQVRKPLANILGLIEMDTAGLSPEALKQRAQHLHASADELDGFVKQLNAFIEQTEKDTLS
jgi:signal transduction histidine kinase